MWEHLDWLHFYPWAHVPKAQDCFNKQNEWMIHDSVLCVCVYVCMRVHVHVDTPECMPLHVGLIPLVTPIL